MPPILRFNLIPKLARALQAVVLLPLLLLLQPGHPGSWFCGSGAWCGSTADLTCCCGSAHQAAAVGCAESAGGHVSAAAHSCDCYYQASPAPAAHPAIVRALGPPDALPAPGFLLPAPSSPRHVHAAAARTESPPPPPLSGIVTRGPPALRPFLV